MALGLDLTQNIVNVHWGTKPQFVVVTTTGQVYRLANFLTNELEPVSLPTAEIITIVGCDYAKEASTFVIAGSAVRPLSPEAPVPGGSAGFICTSVNGIDWDQSFQTPQGTESAGGELRLPWAGTVSAVVYSADSNTFAASCIILKFGLPIQEEIYVSSSGDAWSLSSVKNINSMEEVVTNASVFPASFCSHNSDCIDDIDHSVPGGIMHYDEDGKIQMRPQNPPAIYYWANTIPGNIDYHTLPLRTFGGFLEPIGTPPSSSVMIKRTDSDGNIVQTDIAIPGLAIVTCVAGQGSIWLAGGYIETTEDSPGAVVITRDGGDNWQTIAATPSGVAGIAVGEAKRNAGL